MKAQILSKRNTPVSLIGFLLLVTTTQIGCGIFLFNVNRVLKLDPVLLTQNDLHTIGLTKRNRIGIHPDYPFTIIAGFQQGGSGDLTIQYWLFNSASSAKKTAETGLPWFFAAIPNFQPERNPENIIGDATWRNIHRSPREWENDKTDIYFVKHNLLVSVRTIGHGHLQYARDIAQHIDTKIEAVLKKNENRIPKKFGSLEK